MVGACEAVAGARARAEVEGAERQAAVLQTHHVGTAGSPGLHVAQVRAVLQQGMATADTRTRTRTHTHTHTIKEIWRKK